MTKWQPKILVHKNLSQTPNFGFVCSGSLRLSMNKWWPKFGTQNQVKVLILVELVQNIWFLVQFLNKNLCKIMKNQIFLHKSKHFRDFRICVRFWKYEMAFRIIHKCLVKRFVNQYSKLKMLIFVYDSENMKRFSESYTKTNISF